MSIKLINLGFLCKETHRLVDRTKFALVDCDAQWAIVERGLKEVRTAVRTKRVQRDELTGLPEARDLTECQHHWVIDKPAGPTSRGTCRTCGKERDFQNYIEGTGWGGDASAEHVSAGSRIPAAINAARRDTAKVDDES